MTCSDDVFCIILEKPQREKERHEVEKRMPASAHKRMKTMAQKFPFQPNPCVSISCAKPASCHLDAQFCVDRARQYVCIHISSACCGILSLSADSLGKNHGLVHTCFVPHISYILTYHPDHYIAPQRVFPSLTVAQTIMLPVRLGQARLCLFNPQFAGERALHTQSTRICLASAVGWSRR